MTTYCGRCGYVRPSEHVCRLKAQNERLRKLLAEARPIIHEHWPRTDTLLDLIDKELG